jgi:P4 family phage/plasmid primase-like protien
MIAGNNAGLNAGRKEEIRRAAEEVYLRGGTVAEIRGLGSERGFTKTVSGWFDDPEAFVEAANKLEGADYAVYATLNPCPESLLARAYNKLAPGKDAGSTSDTAIERRRWLPIDLDPKREANISSSEEERAEAHRRAKLIRGDLQDRGIPAIYADSGNGAHLLIPIDLPNTEQSLKLVEGVLKALDHKYSDAAVDVDTAVGNASRIFKVYGTSARKGDSVEKLGRVHRPSAILDVPAGLEPVSEALLRELASEGSEEPEKTLERRPRTGGDWSIDEWIARYEVPVKRAGDWNGGRKWVLDECPWNNHDNGSCYIVELPTGAISAGCHHNSCKQYGWRDLREHFEPGAYDRAKSYPSFAGPARAFEPTDTGNGERFAAEHGGDVRWVKRWNAHMVWTGRKWEQDFREDVTKRAQRTAKGIHRDAANPELDVDAQRRITKHAVSSQSALRIRAMIDLAKPHMIATHDEFDADPWLLNCQNGIVDLRTGALREHDREALITKATPVEYDPEAEAPVFHAFLEKIVPQPEVRAFLRRAFGMALAGEIRDNVLIILYGTGSNGKSTLMDAVMEAFGDYAISSAPDLLMSKGHSHPTELADLFGARLVSCMESEEGRSLNEGLVKQLTGRDRVKARRMREDFWEFDPTHSVFLGTNHKPEIRGTDHAIWRRLKLVPFEVTIPDAEQDKDLPAKLQAELPGILRWAVEGCLEWRRDGLQEPTKVTEATQSYRADMDVLAQFIAEECVEGGNLTAKATPLFRAYQNWCRDKGEESLTQRKFGDRLKERGYENEKRGTYFWKGIGLKSDDTDPDGEPEGPGGGPLAAKGPEQKNALSGLGKGHDTNSAKSAGPSGQKSDMNGLEQPRVEGYAEKRSKRSKGPESEVPHSAQLEPSQSATLEGPNEPETAPEVGSISRNAVDKEEGGPPKGESTIEVDEDGHYTLYVADELGLETAAFNLVKQLERLKDEGRDPAYIGLDIETTTLTPEEGGRIRLIQLSCRKVTCLIDCDYVDPTPLLVGLGFEKKESNDDN